MAEVASAAYQPGQTNLVDCETLAESDITESSTNEQQNSLSEEETANSNDKSEEDIYDSDTGPATTSDISESYHSETEKQAPKPAGEESEPTQQSEPDTETQDPSLEEETSGEEEKYSEEETQEEETSPDEETSPEEINPQLQLQQQTKPDEETSPTDTTQEDDSSPEETSPTEEPSPKEPTADEETSPEETTPEEETSPGETKGESEVKEEPEDSSSVPGDSKVITEEPGKNSSETPTTEEGSHKEASNTKETSMHNKNETTDSPIKSKENATEDNLLLRAGRSNTTPVEPSADGEKPVRTRRKSRRSESTKSRKKRRETRKKVAQAKKTSSETSDRSVGSKTEQTIGEQPVLRENARRRKYRPTSQHIKHSRLLRCVKATENFSGTEVGELTGVHIGDTITLRGEPSAGWCEGECNGKTGWFPIKIAGELATERKVLLSLEVSQDSEITLFELPEGVDATSLITNKKTIETIIERKLKKRPQMSELLDRNILGADNSPSEQLLKNIEQQKKAAVLTNLLAGRGRTGKLESDIPTDSPRTTSFEEEEEESTQTPRKSSVTDEEISCTDASDEDRDETIEEKAIQLFESKPTKAVKMLIDNGIIKNSAEAIADFLYCNPRLSGKMVGEYLGENEELNLKVLDAFIDKMNLTDTEFDQAMRKFLFVFYLPGEAQKIDRIMCAFAKKYYMQNSGESRTHGKIFKHQDSVYLLAFATIMLNTDLHSMNVKTKMTQEQFVHRTNDGTFPDVFLKDLYQRIAEEEIRTKDDKFTRAAKRGYLYLEKKAGLRGRKKQFQYWFVLDPDSRKLYAFKEKDEQKLMEEFELKFLFIKEKQTPTADRNHRYPLQFVYSKQKPPELRLLTRSQRLWVDWLTIFTEVLQPKVSK